jgi:hypothetical protein
MKKNQLESKCIRHPDGSEEWRLNGHFHREGGPAIIKTNGDKYWMQNDKYHREDGPAIEFPSMNYYKFYIRGKSLHFVSNTQQLKAYLNNKAFW